MNHSWLFSEVWMNCGCAFGIGRAKCGMPCSSANTRLSWPWSCVTGADGICWVGALVDATSSSPSITNMVKKKSRAPVGNKEWLAYSWLKLWCVDGYQWILTQNVGTGIENCHWLTIANGFGQRVNQNWQIASNVVHHEQKDANSCWTYLQWDNFDKYSEHNTEPHFSWNVKRKNKWLVVDWLYFKPN